MGTAGLATSLAGAMEEHGPPCSSSEQTFRDLIKSFNTVSEQDVAEVLGMMARTLDSKASPVRPVPRFWPVMQPTWFGQDCCRLIKSTCTKPAAVSSCSHDHRMMHRD